MDGDRVENIEQVARDCLTAFRNSKFMFLDGLGVICPTKLRNQLVPVLFDDESHELLRRTRSTSVCGVRSTGVE